MYFENTYLFRWQRSAELSKRLQYRVVGLLRGPISLKRLAAGDPNTAGIHLVEKRFDYGRFSETLLPCNKHDLPFASPCPSYPMHITSQHPRQNKRPYSRTPPLRPARHTASASANTKSSCPLPRREPAATPAISSRKRPASGDR